MKLAIGPSTIQGDGLFALHFIPRGSAIFPAARTVFGYPVSLNPIATKINHCIRAANVQLKKQPGSYDVIAMRDIHPHEELTINYHYTPWWVDKNTIGYVAC